MNTHDYIHHYRGYWSDGGKCRIRIYQEDGNIPLVICSQLPDNENTSVTNMAEYLAAEVIGEHGLATPLTWIEHYPEQVCLGGVWRYRVGSPRWSSLPPLEVDLLIGKAVKEQLTVPPTSKKPL